MKCIILFNSYIYQKRPYITEKAKLLLFIHRLLALEPQPIWWTSRVQIQSLGSASSRSTMAPRTRCLVFQCRLQSTGKQTILSRVGLFTWKYLEINIGGVCHRQPSTIIKGLLMSCFQNASDFVFKDYLEKAVLLGWCCQEEKRLVLAVFLILNVYLWCHVHLI